MIRQRRRELEALVDAVAPPGWRADRRWRALLAAAAVCEPWGEGDLRYLASNGEPHADTLMGSPGPGPTDLAGWIGWAIAAAHAAVAALAAREGTFPAQPMRVRLVRRRGVCRAVPAEAPTTVAFALGDRLVTATLDARGPAAEHALAERLARVARGEAAAEGARPPALVAVTVGDEPLDVAHHGHRRAWTAGGGPWLGVGRAEGLTLLSTCHLAVDGYGHAHLAGDVASAIDRAAIRTLAAAAGAITGSSVPPAPRPVGGEVVPLGVAWKRLPGPTPRVARQAWALGRVLATGADGRLRARGTTLQLPVAAGPLDDPTRFARRVRTALVTVRCPDSAPEPLDGFAARLREVIADEAVGRGLFGRLQAALAGVPLPFGLKRRWLGGARHGAGGPAEVLAGDGCLSLLRLGGLPPLVACSAPGQLHPAEGEASAVLTVVDDGQAATATLAGRGAAGTTAGATRLLEAWAEGLDDAQAATIGA